MPSLLASLPVFQGKRPKVPDWADISLATEQGKAVAANTAALPALTELGRDVNSYNQSERDRMLELAMPGYNSLLSKQRGIIESQLRGEIPEDVQRQIRRETAYGALKGGFGGSEMGRNLTARDLGLTSLNLTNNAIDSASRWMANTANLKMPGQFDVTSMFVTPQQMFAATFQNQMQKFERDTYAAKIAAAPAPWAAHMGAALDSIADTALSMVSGMGGGMMGGGGGGGGMGSMLSMGGGSQTFQSPSPGVSSGASSPSTWNWN